MSDAQLDFLGNLFIEKRILDRKGIIFIQFLELFKRGKIEEILD